MAADAWVRPPWCTRGLLQQQHALPEQVRSGVNGFVRGGLFVI